MTIPSTVRVRDVSILVTKGTTPTTIGRTFTTSGVRFIKVETIGNDGTYISGREAYIDHETHKILSRSQLNEGDILFSIAGALGRSTVVESSWLPANTNQAFAIIRPSVIRHDILPRFLLWQLRSPRIARHVAEVNVQAAQANLSLEQVRDFKIPLMSIQTQERLVKALDDIDNLITTLGRLMTKKQAIKQGMMQQLLTGKTRLPGFTEPWENHRLGDLCSMRSGGTPSTKISQYYGGGIPWVSISDMTASGKYVDSTEVTLTRDGLDASAAVLYDPDLVLYAMYASLGEVCLAVGSVSSSQAILGIQPYKDLDREYLYYHLESIKPHVKKLGQQGTQSNLNAGMVREFYIHLPPYNEQLAIVRTLSDADVDIMMLKSRLTKALAVKSGMMQELLTGRTRLPVKESSKLTQIG